MTDFPRDAVETSLVERFETVVDAHPQRTAISDEGEAWTYAELDARANRLARRIRRDGDCAAPVLLLLGHGAHEIAGMLGTLKAGGAYVALDPGTPLERLRTVARDVGAARIVTHARHRELAGELAPDVIELEAADAAPSDARLGLPIAAGDLATIVYTSGSTGAPKGVMRSHRCVLHRAWLFAEGQRATPDDRVAHMFSCSFVAAEVDVYGALLSGATVCSYPTRRWGVGPLAEWLVREQISLLHPPPALFRRFLDGLDGPLSDSAVRSVSLGGERAGSSDVEQIRRIFPGCSVIHRFSSTETSVLTRVELPPGTPIGEASLPAGRPVADKAIELVDAAGEPVAPGESGEIEVRSRYLADGYWRNPELTRERFRAEADGETRRYRTGDLGRWRPDGMLQHLGRADRQVKVRGFRVEPVEVEIALTALDPVREAAVVARPDPRGETQLVAWVVPAEPDAADAPTLRRLLTRKLPRSMHPARFAFVSQLPTTPTGKTDRRALAERDPEERLTPLPQSAPDAVDGLEFQIRLLWNDVMGRRDIGAHDDFFDLGGDSILAAELMMRVQRLFGETPALADFVATPTVAAMASHLRGKRPVASHRYLVPMRTGGGSPPFFCVHPDTGSALHFVNLVRHLDASQPFYALQARGVDGCGVPHERIEAMAADYVAEIRSVQPHGPYYLGGRCVGGQIAAEMARQLMTAGEEVAIVAVFDAYGPRVIRLVRRVKDAWRRLQARRSGASGEPAPGPPEAFRTHLKRARKRFRPKPYPGAITLFWAGADVKNNLRGWYDFAAGGVDFKPVAGDHDTILREPHVAALARGLEASLATARHLWESKRR